MRLADVHHQAKTTAEAHLRAIGAHDPAGVLAAAEALLPVATARLAADADAAAAYGVRPWFLRRASAATWHRPVFFCLSSLCTPHVPFCLPHEGEVWGGHMRKRAPLLPCWALPQRFGVHVFI